ncbi:MAG: flagellar basal body rod protein FlgC [Gammaproteobacteria bacterium]|nr:flagellar basal body rod protein FlgC [Gammaproteobacteria bacterium]MCP4983750.1 flagellar basal body rod protein FlgC [Gammaproteobacteria bacterium]
MGLFANFNISGSAISAQSIRLNTTASNLANVETMASSEAEAYRSRQPVFQAFMNSHGGVGEVGVQMLDIVESQRAVERRYDPGHALANEDGFVFGSNVNPVEEMANMISASRAYQNNVEVLNTSRDLLLRVLSLGS